MSNFEGHESVTGSHLLDAVYAASVAQSIMEDVARSTPQFAGYDENGEPIWLTPPPIVYPEKQYAFTFKQRNAGVFAALFGIFLIFAMDSTNFPWDGYGAALVVFGLPIAFIMHDWLDWFPNARPEHRYTA